MSRLLPHDIFNHPLDGDTAYRFLSESRYNELKRRNTVQNRGLATVGKIWLAMRLLLFRYNSFR